MPRPAPEIIATRRVSLMAWPPLGRSLLGGVGDVVPVELAQDAQQARPLLLAQDREEAVRLLDRDPPHPLRQRPALGRQVELVRPPLGGRDLLLDQPGPDE